MKTLNRIAMEVGMGGARRDTMAGIILATTLAACGSKPSSDPRTPPGPTPATVAPAAEDPPAPTAPPSAASSPTSAPGQSVAPVAWHGVAPEHPDDCTRGACVMRWSDRRRAILLLSDDALWAWGGDRWRRQGDPLPAWPVDAAVEALGALHLFGVDDGHLVHATLERPGDVAQIGRVEDGRVVGAALDHAGAAARFVVLVAKYGGGSRIFAWSPGDRRARALPETVATLDGLAARPDGHAVVAYARGQSAYALVGDRWVAGPSLGRHDGLAWDAGRGAFVTPTEGADGSRQLVAWRAAAPDVQGAPTGQRLPTTTHRGALAYDPERRQHVYFGGDVYDEPDLPCAATWVATDGGDFALHGPDQRRLPLRGYTSAVLAGDRLLFVDHASLATRERGPEGWRPVALAPEAPLLDGRYVNVAAAPERLYALVWVDGRTQLWSATLGADARWAPLGDVPEPPDGPPSSYSHRTALAWDPVGAQLLRFGGPEDNLTWRFRDGRWRALDDDLRPPAGIGAMATTPEGVYLLVEEGLWRFVGDRWQQVAQHPGRVGGNLAYDPVRGRLIATLVAPEDDHRLALHTLEAGSWRRVLTLPEGRWGDRPTDPHLALDPRRGEALLFDADEVRFAADLRGLPPAGPLPRAPVARPSARAAAPAAARIPASALRRAPGPARSWAELGVEIDVPAGWRVLALIPREGAATADWPATARGVAVLLNREALWEGRPADGNPGDAGLAVRWLAEAPPLAILDPDGDSDAPPRYVPGRLTAYEELSEADRARYNTPSTASEALALGSKLGGDPRFVQDDPRERHPGLRYLLTLGPELFDYFGDVGAAFVFVDASGRAVTFAQSH